MVDDERIQMLVIHETKVSLAPTKTVVPFANIQSHTESSEITDKL
jgi:hypothetical protein